MLCRCGYNVEFARAELNLKTCRQCAFSGPDIPRAKGTMIYSHKTAGEIEIHSAESWKENKKYYVPNGSRSCVKNFSKNVCG